MIFYLFLVQRYYEIKRHLCFCGTLHYFFTSFGFSSSNSPLKVTHAEKHMILCFSSFIPKQWLIIIKTLNKLLIITSNCQ